MNSNRLLCNLKIIISLKIVIAIEFEVGHMQLDLPLLLRDKLQWVNDIAMYDPVLTPLEQKAIRVLNCTCPSIGEE